MAFPLGDAIGDLIAAAIAAAIFSIFAAGMLIWRSRLSSSMFQRWARRESIKLFSFEKRDIDRGPFAFTTTGGQAVYRLRAELPDGSVVEGWARCGGWSRGLYSNMVEIQWDQRGFPVSFRTVAPQSESIAGDVAISIAPAAPVDVPLILELIRGLAEYEKLSHEVIATEELLREHLFGAKPMGEVLIARIGADAVGFALYFHNYSTFVGRPGIYLEDLYVRPEFRKHGIGKALLKAVARIALERNCGRLEWSVLDWNEPAIRFYHSLGSRAMTQWTIHRVTGDDLQKLGGA